MNQRVVKTTQRLSFGLSFFLCNIRRTHALLGEHNLKGTFMLALEFYYYDQTISSISYLLILKININTDSGPQQARGSGEDS